MRLLFAEDERSLSRAVCAILKKNNYSVDAVFNGADALDYLATENYDGVILDVMMPKVDGFTVLRRMREAGNKTPVLMLTARSEIDDKVFGLDSGANDYLTKPFDTKELLARIRVMTRQAAVQTDSTLCVGNLTLDVATYDMKGPDGQFKLAGKEFQMLEMLKLLACELELSVRTFQARRQGVSDAGNADAEPEASPVDRRVHGPHLGI